MRKATLIFLCICCFTVHCQITQLYTGTTVTIKHLSCVGNTVLIGGLSKNFLAKSYNEGYNLIPLPCPGPTVNNCLFQRLDKDTVFLLSTGYTELYRSTDGANSWSKQMDTALSVPFYPNAFAFFNGRDGIADYGYGNLMFKTMNGGAAWTLTTSPLGYTTQFKAYDDSMIIMGGSTPPAVGEVFFLSKNRGRTWSYGSGSFSYYTDFFFLNKDTIFGVIQGGGFTKTTNGGQLWDDSSEPPINKCYGVYFKSSEEGYLIGANQDGNGLIIKTNDLGKTWSTFNTGIKTILQSIVFLNDSIALLSGTNGALLRWNYTKTVFTGIGENYLDNVGLKIFPNPVKDKLSFEFSNVGSENLKLTITNTLGQFIYSKEEVDLKKEMDVSFLKSGIYYLKLESDKGQKVFKFIKE